LYWRASGDGGGGEEVREEKEGGGKGSGWIDESGREGWRVKPLREPAEDPVSLAGVGGGPRAGPPGLVCGTVGRYVGRQASTAYRAPVVDQAGGADETEGLKRATGQPGTTGRR